jgi:hypothetical protein
VLIKAKALGRRPVEVANPLRAAPYQARQGAKLKLLLRTVRYFPLLAALGEAGAGGCLAA